MMSFTQEEQAAIARTGFMMSLVSYILFWGLDVIRPGFVARFFSVHIFLIGVIVFGVWWGSVVQEYIDRPVLQHILLFVCGIFAAVLVWNLGSVFGGWRVIISLIACVFPVLVLRFVKYK